MDEKVFGGRYRVVREMGVRAGRRSYLAVGPDEHNYVVDVVEPRDPRRVETLEAELSAASGIDHPSLARIVEWGREGAGLFVVSEHVPGADLESEIGQYGRMAPTTAAHYGADVASALEQIHRRGLVHGDVRTDTIVRLPEDVPGELGEVKLTSFGMGPRDPADVSVDPQPGAAYYLAPERIAGGAIGAPADIYSLGAVLYELVSGHVPFDGPTASAVTDLQQHATPAPLSDLVPNIPPSLDHAIMRALEKSPQARFASAAEMSAALDRVDAELAPAVRITPRSTASRGWLWAAIIAGVVVVALVAAWALGLFGSKVAVPDLYATSVSEASSTLQAAGLSVGAVSYTGAAVTGVADGSVATQSPAPGARVARGSAVDLVIAGQERALVPSVIGQTQADAVAALRAAGFAIGPVTQVATAAAEPGIVYTQSPAGGISASKGTAVSIGVAQQPPIAGAVPDVRGVTQDQASATLTSAGFRVSVSSQASSDVPVGSVISQAPAAGDQALKGSTVAIVVSSGPTPIDVPAVTTMTQAAATNTLSDAGFKVKVTTVTGGGTVGTVTAQNPAAGTKALPGSTVLITVAQ